MHRVHLILSRILSKDGGKLSQYGFGLFGFNPFRECVYCRRLTGNQ